MSKMLRLLLVATAVAGVPCVGFAQDGVAGIQTQSGGLAASTAQGQGSVKLAGDLSSLGAGLAEIALLPEFSGNQETGTEMQSLQADLASLQQNLGQKTAEQLRSSLLNMQTKLNGLGPKIAGETAKKVAEMVGKLNLQIDGMVKGIMVSTEAFVDHTVNQAADTTQKALDAGLKQGMDAAAEAMKQAQQTTDNALEAAREQTDAALRDAMQGIQTGAGSDVDTGVDAGE